MHGIKWNVNALFSSKLHTKLYSRNILFFDRTKYTSWFLHSDCFLFVVELNLASYEERRAKLNTVAWRFRWSSPLYNLFGSAFVNLILDDHNFVKLIWILLFVFQILLNLVGIYLIKLKYMDRLFYPIKSVLE